MIYRVFWILWLTWVSTTVVSVARHDLATPLLPNVRQNGCYFLWSGNRWATWPMQRTKAVVCMRTTGRLDAVTP